MKSNFRKFLSFNRFYCMILLNAGMDYSVMLSTTPIVLYKTVNSCTIKDYAIETVLGQLRKKLFLRSG